MQHISLDTQCAQLTGGGSGSGGKAAQARRGGEPLGRGGTWPASDLPAPELGAPCPRWGAATGGHGSNPEPTAHTCTTSEHSAAAVSEREQKGEREERKRERVSLLNQPKKPPFQHFLSALRIFGIGLIYFMQSWQSAVINAALARWYSARPKTWNLWRSNTHFELEWFICKMKALSKSAHIFSALF